MRNFLKLNPRSKGLGRQVQVVALMDRPPGGLKAMLSRKNFGPFCSLLWILCAGCRKRSFGDQGLVVVVFEIEKKLYYHTLYISLIIMKSLQLHEHRQIAEPRKYCLMHMIFFFFGGRILSLFFFFFLTDWKFQINSLQQQTCKNPMLLESPTKNFASFIRWPKGFKFFRKSLSSTRACIIIS